MPLEPHPVSGEVEIDDIRPAKYRRLDEETLHARLEVEQFEISPIYVWCETDEHGGTGPGWKLAELRGIEDQDEEGVDWFDTMTAANEAAPVDQLSNLPQESAGMNGDRNASTISLGGASDDYWAAYDRTPGRTPAQKHSPAPQSHPYFQTANRRRSRQELDYFARYGTEVQPALDNHDPDEEKADTNQSALNGVALPPAPHDPHQIQQAQEELRPESRPRGTSLFPPDTQPQETSHLLDVSAPRPISPTSSHGSSIDRLESRAAEMSEEAQQEHDRAHMAITQHISTDIKSLFRLAKNTGMERSDFERIVKTELECLGFLEEGELS